MKKKIFLLSALCLLEVQWSMAQAPKWVDKAKRAVFSVITYGENDKILNTGNGFFVTEDGVALSDCSLFEGAQRAVVVNSEGVQMPVVSIMGANDMYDVIKFRVGISTKKSPGIASGNRGSGCGRQCVHPALFHTERPFLYCRTSESCG